MTVVLLMLAAVLIGLSLMLWRASRGELHSRLRSRVLVTLKTGATFDGVLYATDRSVWVLRNAQALGAGDNGATVPVDGEVLVLVADIDFAQKP